MNKPGLLPLKNRWADRQIITNQSDEYSIQVQMYVKYTRRLKEGNNSLCLEIRGKHKDDIIGWRRKGKGIPSREKSESKGRGVKIRARAKAEV